MDLRRLGNTNALGIFKIEHWAAGTIGTWNFPRSHDNILPSMGGEGDGSDKGSLHVLVSCDNVSLVLLFSSKIYYT